ncbi:MAG: hypothetical protein LIP77_09010 [Planctomycetes bacterium]|nr:hypothetical protein [Planctomycetota bacterium]
MRDRDLPTPHGPDHREADEFAFGRPPVSAWVAALSVAIMLFIAGGFIKTYQRLEAMREEHRREISDLREAVRRLQAAAGARPASTIQPLPDAPRSSLRPDPEGPIPPATTTAASVARSGLPVNPRSRTALARRGGPDDPAEPQRQVVALAPTRRRVLIEGGRDRDTATGARLRLYRNGIWIGDLRVEDVYDNQSSCEVIHALHDPVIGDVARPDR